MERQLERFSKEELIKMYAKIARKYVKAETELYLLKEKAKEEE